MAGSVRAKAVVTLPLGVLQAGQRPVPPELPRKSAAAEQLAVGPVVRITFHFRERFWERITPGLCMLHTARSGVPDLVERKAGRVADLNRLGGRRSGGQRLGRNSSGPE